MGLLGKFFRDHGKKDKGSSVVAVADAGLVIVEAEHNLKVKEKSVFTKLSSRPMSFVGKRDSIISAKPTAAPQAPKVDRVQQDRSPYGKEENNGNGGAKASSAPVSSQSSSKFIIGDADVASSSSSTVDSISSTSGENTTADTSPSTSSPSIPLKTTAQSSGSLASMRRTSPLSTVVDSNSLPTPPPSPLPPSRTQVKPQRRSSLINMFSLKKAKSQSNLSLPHPGSPSPPISSNSSSTSLRSTSSRNTTNTGGTSGSGRSRGSFRAPMPLNHPDLAFVPSVEDFTHSSILAGDPLGGNYYLYPKSGRVPPPPRRRTAPAPSPPFPSHPSQYGKQQRFMEPTILEETGGNNPPFNAQRRQNGPRPQDPRRRSMPVPPQHYNNLNMYLAPPQQTRRRSMYNNYENGGMPMPPRNNSFRRPPPGNAGEPRSFGDGRGMGRGQPGQSGHPRQAGQQGQQGQQMAPRGEGQTEKRNEGAEVPNIPTVTVEAAT
ncbi:hypothetical protein BJ508DRAFT_309813 [Ascobolus immersus RN42]|uniref:Uncharacterized protein n=1 Tax=Ascobolus immersus RN42 TaxID=1160509 RepID=A0A3N4HVF3_ASCIM|nr:hypothetical protein BJ508DRAFT_309813 [Ascobolus immersus RN42]